MLNTKPGGWLRVRGNWNRIASAVSQVSWHLAETIHAPRISGTEKAVKSMPVGRYLLFVGSVLLALLFVSDRYFPEQIAPSARADVDRSAIRVHSRHKWPDAVVYDTSLPTIVPPVAVAGGVSEKLRLDPLAQVPPALTRTREQLAEAALPKAAAVKHLPKRRVPIRRVANYQPYESRGFFQVGW